MIQEVAGEFDLSDPQLVSLFDELPLWSAPFGLLLLDTVRLGRGLQALDIGCGTGFPLLELAQRLGSTGHVSGLDPWQEALKRVELKIARYQIPNVSLTVGTAERMPFEKQRFDLIVSNNGLNNVNDQAEALAECYRTAKAGAQLILTLNLPDTMAEFYTVFEQTLKDLGQYQAVERMKQHILEKRKPLAEVQDLLKRSGFTVSACHRDTFRYRFVDGSALFRYHFVRLAFLNSWRQILDEEQRESFFFKLENRLNERAQEEGQLVLTIPFVCLDCRRR
jgi:ubiquinone/menaquinone biosynthesis C-methylase UbiE